MIGEAWHALGEIAINNGDTANLIQRWGLGLFGWPAWTAVMISLRLRVLRLLPDPRSQHNSITNGLGALVCLGVFYSVFSAFLAVRVHMDAFYSWAWISGWMIVPAALSVIAFPLLVLANGVRPFYRSVIMASAVLALAAMVMLAAGLSLTIFEPPVWPAYVE